MSFLFWKKPAKQPPKNGRKIAVPIVELNRLEQARVALYEYLSHYLTEQELVGLVNITGQIWRVANRKKWD